MDKMDRSRDRKARLAELERGIFVPGTMEERIAMLWPLTVEFCKLSGRYDPERPLQRHITRVIRGGIRTDSTPGPGDSQ